MTRPPGDLLAVFAKPCSKMSSSLLFRHRANRKRADPAWALNCTSPPLPCDNQNFGLVEIQPALIYVDRSTPEILRPAEKFSTMTNPIRSIAIVDDHILFRQTVSRFLHLLGFNVPIEAGNGIELLRLLKTCNSLPEACILDIEMPLMDGIATTRVLRVRYPDIKVVALTLTQDNDKKKRILEAGASSVLFKGMDASDFTDALHRILTN